MNVDLPPMFGPVRMMNSDDSDESAAERSEDRGVNPERRLLIANEGGPRGQDGVARGIVGRWRW